MNKKGYVCLVNSIGRIIVSRHVTFHESFFPFSTPLTTVSLNVSSSIMVPSHILVTSFENSSLPSDTCHDTNCNVYVFVDSCSSHDLVVDSSKHSGSLNYHNLSSQSHDHCTLNSTHYLSDEFEHMSDLDY